MTPKQFDYVSGGLLIGAVVAGLPIAVLIAVALHSHTTWAAPIGLGSLLAPFFLTRGVLWLIRSRWKRASGRRLQQATRRALASGAPDQLESVLGQVTSAQEQWNDDLDLYDSKEALRSARLRTDRSGSQ